MIPRKQISFLLYILFNLIVFAASSQTNYNQLTFRQYKMIDGLPTNNITSVAQDKRGFIWLGTESGISRFDGTSFVNYNKNDRDIQLKSDDVKSVQNLNDSLVAILTSGGCNIVNTYNMRSLALTVDDSGNKKTLFLSSLNDVRSVFRRKNGNYIMLTVLGLYEFNPEGKIIFRQEHFDETLKTKNDFERKEIFNLGHDKLAIYAFKELSVFDFRSHKNVNGDIKNSLSVGADSWVPEKDFPTEEISRKQISKFEFLFIKVKADSLYYLNIDEGILKGSKLPEMLQSQLLYFEANMFPLGNNEFAIPGFKGGFYTFKLKKDHTVEFAPVKFLPDHYCNSIYKDRDARLWIGTSNGLLKQTDINTEITKNEFSYNSSEELFQGNIYIYKDKIFISTITISDSNFLTVLDLNTKKELYKFNLPDKPPLSGLACSMRSYYKDTLWISTSEGILWMNTNNFKTGKIKLPEEIKNYPINFGPVDSSGKAWMHTFTRKWHILYDVNKRNFTIYSLDTKIKTLLKRPSNLVRDSYGNIWFYGYGLERWNKQKEIFDTLIKDFGNKTGYQTYIDFVTPDNHGKLWIYYEKTGFIVYDIQKNSADVLKNNQNIPSKRFNSFSSIHDDIIWCGYADMLVSYNTLTGKSSVYNQNEGVPDGAFTGNIYYHEPSQTNFVCSGKNLLSFKNIRSDFTKTKIQIDNIFSAKNKTIFNPSDTVTFNYSENTLTIRFNSIDFSLKYPRQFIYQVDENGSWNTTTSTQPIFLYNLSPGWHSVIIKSRTNPDQFSEKRLTVYIIPPIWKTTWFIVIMCFLALILTVCVIVFFIRKAKKENDLLLQLKEFELKALHAQMNPHFIFNCLNSIKALVVNGKNKEASKYINYFSKLVRLNLSHSRKPFISLKENIEYIDLYLQSEKLRFTDFNYECYVDPLLESEHILVMPMLIQPIIENAIWHGLQSISSGRNLKLRYEKYESGAKCIIDDNGIGINQSVQNKVSGSRDSVGMDNIRERISLFNKKYKLNYRIEITDKKDLSLNETGTIVTIFFNTKT